MHSTIQMKDKIEAERIDSRELLMETIYPGSLILLHKFHMRITLFRPADLSEPRKFKYRSWDHFHQTCFQPIFEKAVK